VSQESEVVSFSSAGASAISLKLGSGRPAATVTVVTVNKTSFELEP